MLLGDNMIGNISGVVEGNLNVNFSRIICALLLHILIVPEVRTAMSMLDYASQEPFGFLGNGSIYPFLLGVLKCSSGMLTEFVNVMIIVKSQTTYDILYDFVALKIIAQIDDMMGNTLKPDINIASEIENLHISYKSEPIMSIINKYVEALHENKRESLYQTSSKIHASIICM